MRVKRVKKANKILTFFKFNYKIAPPFKVIVDGTFCLAALNDKINIREQMPKYLSGECELYTTPCVIKELETLGDIVYGALHICKQFEVEKCPHTTPRSASECFANLARRMNTGHTKYIFATQDESLSKKLQLIPGVPRLFVKYNAIVLERVSEASKASANKSTDEMEKLKELKRIVLGEGPEKKKKKKKKGVNPLSCKKKKVVPVSAPKERTGERTIAGKRRRSKKKAESVVEGESADA